jgi:hypothetical protein
MVLTFGACGGGSSDTSSDTTPETTETTGPPATFSADSEAAFLKTSQDPRAGKLAEIADDKKLDLARSSCSGLKDGLTGKEVYDTVRKEIPTSDVKDEELGFFIGAAVGSMCPDQTEQLKKGF